MLGGGGGWRGARGGVIGVGGVGGLVSVSVLEDRVLGLDWAATWEGWIEESYTVTLSV